MLTTKKNKEKDASHAIANIEQPVVQNKLKVGNANDKYEQEANSIAESIASPESSTLPPVRNYVGSRSGQVGNSIQKQEDEEEEMVQTKTREPSIQRMTFAGNEEGDDTIQAKAESGKNTEVAPHFASRVNSVRGGGQNLPDSTRGYFEPRFGADFSNVKIHHNSQANTLSRDMNARAFTIGNDIVFGEGEYVPEQVEGKKLLAHELTHVVQQNGNSQMVQKNDPPLPTRNLRVFVIGAPAPGEISANHPYQFVDAARFQGVDENTVWIVERTGYEAGGVSLTTIEGHIEQGHLFWLTPENDLPSILNELPEGSISRFTVFSHGLPGNVTLRYGWNGSGLPNYGLNLSQVTRVESVTFARNARIVFDSCNTGTSDWYSPEGNLAQSFADQTGHNVTAWTGRTSYTEVNDGAEDGDVDVEASRIRRGRHVDSTEMASQYLLDRDPERQVFRPARVGTRVGGFSSYFEISVRLPSTRQFTVPENGSVVFSCPNPGLVGYSSYDDRDDYEQYQERRRTMSGRFWVALYRDEWGRDPNLGTRTFEVEPNSQRATWSDLDAGTYYIEIYRLGGNPGIPLRGDVEVNIYEP